MHLLLGSLVGALLPEPERGTVVRRWGGDPPVASLLLGIVEVVGGMGLIYDSAIGFLRAAADRLATDFLAAAEGTPLTPDQTVGFTWGGAVLWLDWLLRPTSWALLSVFFVGLLRVVAFMTVREAVAEPSAWLLTRVVGGMRRFAASARERADFGVPGQPDEVVAGTGGDLLVLTARLRPEWNDAVTLGIGERFYRIAEQDETGGAGRRRYRYRLVEAPEHEVIRRYLRYETALPPVSAPAPRDSKAPEGAAPGSSVGQPGSGRGSIASTERGRPR